MKTADRSAYTGIFFKLIVYASLIFLTFYLWKRGFVRWPSIQSPARFASSFFFVFLGFLLLPVAWWRMLQLHGYRTTLRECVASTGLTVFAKYVPGKIWVVVGRAAYLADRRGYSTAALSTASLQLQFVELWVGMALGLVGLAVLGGAARYGATALVFLVLLSLFVFNSTVYRVLQAVLKRILGREIHLPMMGPKIAARALPWVFGYWLAWSTGFFFLASSLSSAEVGPSVGLVFPLSATLGIVAVIAPGGLGVREGVMTAVLTLTMPLEDATSIAVASRLWFLAGELFLFLVGAVAAKRS